MVTLDAQVFYQEPLIVLYQQVEEMEHQRQVVTHLEMLELLVDLAVVENFHLDQTLLQAD
tara:strand:+ start:50 stop:229 length:180 start_codon:yes stop_codon:yes gene_type:complete